MESFHGKERHGKHYQLYNNSQTTVPPLGNLSHNSFSKRDSTHPNTTITAEKAIQFMNTSPTDLMSMLQQQQQQPWKLRTRDVAVQEILRERREAIETGRLKGRRLFEPIQRVGATILNEVLSGGGGGEMGQESEVRSLSFDYSEDETYSPPPSSSSLPLLSCHSLDRDQKVKEEEVQDVRSAEARVGNGGRYIIFLSVIAIVLLIFAIYKSWVRRFEEYEVILVPT